MSSLDAAIAEVARVNGVLLDKHDPLLIVRTLAEIELQDHREREERQIQREEKTLADMRQIIAQAATLIDTADKAANRPLLTDAQVKRDIIPALIGSIPWWCAVAGLLLMLAAGVIGYSVHWYKTPALRCTDQQDGSRVCYYFARPASAPLPAPETSAPEPAPAPAPAHAPTKR